MATRSRWYLPQAAALAVLSAAAVLACSDRTNPATPGGDAQRAAPSGTPIPLTMLDCSASVANPTVTCKQSAPGATGPRGDILYGGQDIFVTVSTSSVNYDAGTQKFTFNLRLRNLLRQAIGTSDGVVADPSGVKVFFHQVPTATSGTGAIAVDNADGVATFTAANQPYYRYVTLIDSYLESADKPWQFSVPSSVTSFAFKLFISSPVQFPTGWIDVSEPTFALRRTYTKALFGVVRDQFGRPIPGAVITWSSANPTIATALATGEVTGALPGTVDILATSTNDVLNTAAATQNGAAAFTITGTTLTWTAGAATTDWNTPGNWDRGVSPVAEDSAVVPVLGSAIYPLFTANQSIGRIDVADAAQVSLGAFDLTASQDALAGATGGIVSTVGRVILTGAGKTVGGGMPRLRVSGTYNLASNVNAKAPIRVDLGRVRNTGFRLRAQSF
jgi:hypothetical protein